MQWYRLHAPRLSDYLGDPDRVIENHGDTGVLTVQQLKAFLAHTTTGYHNDLAVAGRVSSRGST